MYVCHGDPRILNVGTAIATRIYWRLITWRCH